MAQQQHIEDLFEDKARKGDGSFAVAYSLLKLATSFEKYRSEMGFGDGERRYPGIGEKIGMELADLQQNVGAVASALQQIADRDD